MIKRFLFWLFPLSAIAAEWEVGSSGTRGLSITPTAGIQRGELIVQYQNKVLGYPISHGHNFSWVVGLHDAVEIGGRVAATDMHSNLFIEPGIRDMSASFKLQLNPLLGLKELPLKFAVGSTDYGGAASLFRSTYAVTSYESPDWWALSAGYAKASGAQVAYNPLGGAFVGASAQLLPGISARIERTQQGTWSSVSASSASWLAKAGAPEGASLYATLNRQLSANAPFNVPTWLSFGIKWPLDGRPGYKPVASFSASNFSANNRDSDPPSFASRGVLVSAVDGSTAAISRADKVASPESVLTTQETLDLVKTLGQALVDMGFEGVHVGIHDGSVVVKVTDSVFDHSVLDGAGSALGVLARADLPGLKQYRLIHSRGGTPTLGFTGDLACLRAWMARYPLCDRLSALTVHYRNLSDLADGVNWQVRGLANNRYKPRLKLNPVHDMYFATEAAFIDYSIGLQTQPYVELWDGGSLEVSKVYHVASTKNYDPGNPFAFTRIPDSSTTRTMLHHTERLRNGFSARISAGQLFTGQYRGGVGELRWDSLGGEWAHVFNTSRWVAPGAGIAAVNLPVIEGGQVVYVSNNLVDKVRSPTILTTRYSPAGSDWGLEVQVGSYWYRDKGLSISSNHWFGDTRFSFFFRRSVPPEPFWASPYTANFLGLEVSFPLTPQKGMKADYFQVKGSPRYGVGVGTPVGRKDNYIVNPWGVPIYIKALVEPPVPNYLASSVMDFDRVGPHYVEYHLERLRMANDRWVVDSQSSTK